ncbi:unnamed protein product [Clonostachys byssicola]|uniref:Uncharacterized protein n=1 Tax=Clonostachys byssicola TaxID=160290 RepID=A0A9N9UMG8_9HYPO|nr:unnamed protein product [Clonostachys byssicola]
MADWVTGSKRHGPHDGHDEQEVTDDAAKRPCLAGNNQLTEAELAMFDFDRASGPNEGFDACLSMDCLMNVFQNPDDATQTISYTGTEPFLADIEYGKASLEKAPQQTPMEEHNDIEDTRPNVSNEELPPPHDTCFGVITVSAISEYNGNKKSLESPVSVEHSKAILRLQLKSSGEYAGFVKSEILAQLLQRKSISVDGKIRAPSEHGTCSKYSGKRELRLVVYGYKSEADAIGNALGDSSFCLQHPSAKDLEPSMDYHNPHLLLRPGSKMPSLELLSIESNTEGAKLDTMDEYSKAHVMRLFDQATHSFTKFEFPTSPRLKSILNR